MIDYFLIIYCLFLIFHFYDLKYDFWITTNYVYYLIVYWDHFNFNIYSIKTKVHFKNNFSFILITITCVTELITII